MDVGAAQAFAAGEEAALAAYLNEQGVAVTARGLPPLVRGEAPVALSLATLRGFAIVGAYTFCTGPGTLDRVRIGRFCSIAPGVAIGPSEHPTEFLSSHPIAYGRGGSFERDRYFATVRQRHDFDEPSATTIGNDVWIGEGAFIRRGVAIGDGAIVAARSVVIKDVPAYHIVAGVPARTIRERFPPPVVEKLLAARWWELDLRRCPPFSFAEVEKAADIICEFRVARPTRLRPPTFEARMSRQDRNWTVRRTA